MAGVDGKHVLEEEGVELTDLNWTVVILPHNLHLTPIHTSQTMMKA